MTTPKKLFPLYSKTNSCSFYIAKFSAISGSVALLLAPADPWGSKNIGEVPFSDVTVDIKI